MKALTMIISNLGVGFLFTLLTFPTPGKHYEGFLWGFWQGAMHGGLFIQNYFTSFFDPTRLLKATSYDGWYNFNWWFSLSLALIILVLNLVLFILEIKHKKQV